MATSSKTETAPDTRAGSPGSLVRRLSLGAAVWVGVLGLTVASVAAWQYWRVSLRSLDARLADEARTLAARITASDGLLEVEIDAPLEGDGAPLDDHRYYGVYDAGGRLLDRTSAKAPAVLASRAPARTRNGYREVLAQGPDQAVVVVGESLTAVIADVRRLAFSLLLACVVGAGLALPVGVWLRRQLARSILQIDGPARVLSPGQPTRIDAAGVDREFAGVASTLNDAFDRLEQALVRERQLTSDASHELRTPVTTLVAETQWALDRPRTAEQYRGALEVCARQSLRMKTLVESLLTLARLEAGALRPARARVALRPLAEETAAELAPLSVPRGVAVQVEGDATAWADQVQAHILLANLLSNAIRYNKPGGVVRVGLSEPDGRVELRVSDTGPGLDAALAARVFERFWRADPARPARDGGHGLGLAISKAIVDAHGGAIRFESRPDCGTTFIVELPRGATQPESRHS
jgi:two-component system heavy metal sensor histidine kinase CusS